MKLKYVHTPLGVNFGEAVGDGDFFQGKKTGTVLERCNGGEVDLQSLNSHIDYRLNSIEMMLGVSENDRQEAKLQAQIAALKV